MALMLGLQETIIVVSLIHTCAGACVREVACTDGTAVRQHGEKQYQQEYWLETSVPATVYLRVTVVPLSH